MSGKDTELSEDLTEDQRTVVEWLDHAVDAMGGTRRPGQRRMAADVALALSEGTHLLAQAGTGTGKSLAYLVPAIHHAVTSASSAPVVIATATLALQAQIMHRDAPRTLDALSDKVSDVKISLLKGRAQYLCKNKLYGGLDEADQDEPLFDRASVSSLGEQVLRLREWAEETETGDRDDLTLNPDDNAGNVSDAAWRHVSVTARECVGASRCPYAEECFSERARREAAESDVVVTNHAMLAIQAFEGLGLLPEHDAVIIDEAHEFPQRVTSAVTGQLSSGIIRSLATAAREVVGKLATEKLAEAGENFETTFASASDGWFHRGLNEAQALAVDTVRAAARDLASEIKDAQDGAKNAAGDETDRDESQARQLVRNRIDEILNVCDRLQGERDDVIWATRPHEFRPETGEYGVIDPHAAPTLYVAPLSVAGALRQGLLQESTCVLTSATLTVGGGNFHALAHRLGLGGSEPYRAIDVGSPFAYRSQGILYLAGDLPAPGKGGPSPQMLDRLEMLLRASHGGALCLFSSRRAAERAAEEMRSRLAASADEGDKEIEILVQGESTLSGLVQEFRANLNSCLFGTMSLWQGVDVPGDALRLVTIDRIPFPRPDDPLVSARTRDAKENGRNGFTEVSANHAAVTLAQGVGRLIRSTDDRGVVAILDSRMVTKSYGKYLTASLPDFWDTTDAQVAAGALGRLAASAEL